MKIHHYGIRGQLHDWIGSGRSLCVVLGGQPSTNTAGGCATENSIGSPAIPTVYIIINDFWGDFLLCTRISSVVVIVFAWFDVVLFQGINVIVLVGILN